MLERRTRYCIAAPTQPTRYGENGGDILDVAITKNVRVKNIETDEELQSDHIAVIYTIEANEKLELPQRPTTTYNWTKFSIKMQQATTNTLIIETPQEIEEAIDDITEKIKVAMEQSKKRQKVRENDDTEKLLPREIINKIRERNRAKKEYNSTRYPPTKTKVNRLNKDIQKEIQEYKILTWKKYINKVYEEQNNEKIYKIPGQLIGKKKAIKIPPLKHEGATATTVTEKVEMLANIYDKQFEPNEVRAQRGEEDEEERGDTLKTNMEEMKLIIKNLKKRKASGHDEISNTALKNLPENAIKQLIQIFNATLEKKHFPKQFKHAIIIPIHKTNKPKSKPTSYRPINLLSAIGKLLERIIRNKIEEEIENKQIQTPIQYGFRKKHSTTMQAMRLCEKAKTAIDRKHTTAAAFLDLSNAFDKIEHKALIHKMKKMKINNNITEIIKHYLTDRIFSVRMEGEVSTIRNVKGGVPQGSALGPILFTLYTNDLPTKQDPRLYYGLFADDTAIAATSNREEHAIKLLQEQMDETTKYLKDWGLTINADKTQTILFNRKHKKDNTKIKVENQLIDWKDSAKYLGIEIDRKLTFTKHIRQTRTKAAAARYRLMPLMNNLPIIEAAKIQKIYIRPIIEYATPVWSLASKSAINTINTFQTKYFTKRLMLTRKDQVLQICQLDDPETRRKNTIEKFYKNIDELQNDTLNDLKERRRLLINN